MLRSLCCTLLLVVVSACGSSPDPRPEPGPRSASPGNGDPTTGTPNSTGSGGTEPDPMARGGAEAGTAEPDPGTTGTRPTDPDPTGPTSTSDPGGTSTSDPGGTTTDPGGTSGGATTENATAPTTDEGAGQDSGAVEGESRTTDPDPTDPDGDDVSRPPDEPEIDDPPDLGDILEEVLDPAEPERVRSIHEDFDRILRTHVRDQGVDYLLLRRDDWETLLGYLDRMARVDLDAMTPRERLAYWINLYNASMIRAVGERLVAGYGPSADEYGIFKEETIDSPEGRISLDAVENSIIRPRFKEARIHVALVCGARSCPPLIPEAYEAARLESQLQANMVAFVQDEARNRVDPDGGTMQLSQLFNWYASDFGGKEGVVAYVDRFHPADVSSARVEGFLEYSWELNIAPPREGRWVSLKDATALMTVPKGRAIDQAKAGRYFEVKDERQGWLQLARLDGQPPVWVEAAKVAEY